MQHQPPTPRRMTARRRLITRSREFCRRCHLFGITDTQAVSLALPEIQALVKTRYRQFAKRYHPDRAAYVSRRAGRLLQGRLFARYTKGYRWFMQLKEETLQQKPGVPARDIPLPWAWDGPLRGYSDAQIYKLAEWR